MGTDLKRLEGGLAWQWVEVLRYGRQEYVHLCMMITDVLLVDLGVLGY